MDRHKNCCPLSVNNMLHNIPLLASKDSLSSLPRPTCEEQPNIQLAAIAPITGTDKQTNNRLQFTDTVIHSKITSSSSTTAGNIRTASLRKLTRKNTVKNLCLPDLPDIATQQS